MKRRIAITAAGVLAVSALGTAPALADDNLGPCNDASEPGNSSYAQHHIVPVAQMQGMGNHGHKPGSHQGYSICLDVHAGD